jgi:hypothetical protein
VFIDLFEGRLYFIRQSLFFENSKFRKKGRLFVPLRQQSLQQINGEHSLSESVEDSKCEQNCFEQLQNITTKLM